MSRLNSVLSEGDDIDELRFSPNVDIDVKLEAEQGLPLPISPRKKAEVYLYKDECTKIWNANKKRLGYRPWNGEETWDNYSEEILSPLKEALLKENDEIIYAARAMNYGEFHRLLYLEYPWLRSLEKRVKAGCRDGPVNISDWSLKAPTFDKRCFKCQIAGLRCEAKAIGVPVGSPEGRRKYKGLSCKYCIASRSGTDCGAWMTCWDYSPSKRVPLTPETPLRKPKRMREEEVGEEETRSAQRMRGPEVSHDDGSNDQRRLSTTLSLSQQNNIPQHNRIPSSIATLDESPNTIKAGYHLLADEMQAECTRLTAEVASMKREYSDLRNTHEKLERELEKIRKSEAAARDDCRRMEESFLMMKRMAGKAETALANLEGPMKELFSRMVRP
ncbi:hypothetical protein ARMGADRAFT_1132019 [Armillaria gallica]|uniref:Uncharacterized protein n=1 Tax=Armillaria gallica TaxID=47427 RepID=A0A2H3CSR3_ARMGA|nr:hypothetical protein ARMGADRAFT_1132019 [Armillaria gallica]